MIELKSVFGTCGAGNIKNVSFRLPNGKTYGIFSSRYADAVTLCALMAGAHTPTEGTIFAGGFDLHREAKQARRGIGYLPANLLPDDELTPLEYLMAVADARELSFDKTLRYAHELLELADLADKKDRLIASLSQGEKRILSICQLLLSKPEILILTSPLAGVTPKDAERIRGFIRYLSDTYTIFISTPSAQDLRGMCSEILVLQDGSLKTVTAANDESWTLEFPVVPPEDTPASNAPKKRTNTRWNMLMQKSGGYEVIETDQEEDEN